MGLHCCEISYHNVWKLVSAPHVLIALSIGGDFVRKGVDVDCQTVPSWISSERVHLCEELNLLFQFVGLPFFRFPVFLPQRHHTFTPILVSDQDVWRCCEFQSEVAGVFEDAFSSFARDRNRRFESHNCWVWVSLVHPYTLR